MQIIQDIKNKQKNMKYIKLFEAKEDKKWEILSAKRADGQIFGVGDKYLDNNNSEYTIKKMWMNSDGNIMAEAKEGGQIGLWNVKKQK